MEILVESNDEALDYVIERLREKLPYTIKDLYYILAAKRSKEASKVIHDLSEKLLPTFYFHRSGLKENCTIFGITGESDHTVWYFTFEDSLSELRECLESTKLIRWGSNALFVTIHKEQTGPLLDCIERKNCNLRSIDVCGYFWHPKEEALKLQIEIPDGFKIRQLTADDSQLCNSLWAYRSKNSASFIRSLILLDRGFGLFNSLTDELLSFAIVNDHLATGVLTTVEHARGKGFGKLIANFFTRRIAETFDLVPTVYIDTTNARSLNLYDKLGYKKIGGCDWIVIDGWKEPAQKQLD